ncbi:hypothetical protein B0T17DRAFT_241534 [Bombardia bombarda]|uniref:Uncharacterized protein n=1 Tax=Bombardia bombarda TaxID=252184 RepID=A0AA39XC00_9PEZI|nr:hypothetical protein B0T17DRAFT_241534 [Bombardia bombarda]
MTGLDQGVDGGSTSTAFLLAAEAPIRLPSIPLLELQTTAYPAVQGWARYPMPISDLPKRAQPQPSRTPRLSPFREVHGQWNRGADALDWGRWASRQAFTRSNDQAIDSNAASRFHEAALKSRSTLRAGPNKGACLPRTVEVKLLSATDASNRLDLASRLVYALQCYFAQCFSKLIQLGTSMVTNEIRIPRLSYGRPASSSKVAATQPRCALTPPHPPRLPFARAGAYYRPMGSINCTVDKSMGLIRIFELHQG